MCFAKEPFKLKGKYDKLLILLLAIVIIFLFAMQRITGSKGAYITITQNGTVIGKYSLYENETFTIYTSDNHLNTICIDNGQVWIEDADCPDGLCVKQGAISRNGESIICLPHKLVITVETDHESEIDSVSK